ncbi:MAG: hypothetical protein ACYTGL_17960 [Planctomycetota bacterium]
MSEWTPVFELVLLIIGYWGADFAIRLDGIGRTLRIGRVPAAAHAVVLSLLALALSALWTWDAVVQSEFVRLAGASLAGLLSWKAGTKDIDPVFGDDRRIARYLLAASAVGAWFSPAFLILSVYLLTAPFALWEHHSTLPMRILQVIVAWLGLSTVCSAGGMQLFQDVGTLVFFILTIQISHYLITALAKGWLGPKWYSWITDNRIHHLAANAYSWGWARFLPWSTWKRVIGTVKVVERPMQLFAFGVELLAPLALLDQRLAVAFCIGWALFHLGVFALSGLLFWDWIATDLILAYAIAKLPAAVSAFVFGPVSVLVAIVFMAAFPLRHKLWKPMPLGWWDTPLTQRMYWRAHGASGKVYGVYNNFMCPYERLYGKLHACFLAPVAGFTYHLGEVWKRDLRDAIRAAGPNETRLDAVRQQFGVQPRDEALAKNHVAWLKRFFHAVNSGKRKRVLPRWLRWLKAPGDQVFYWGDLPAFRGQEEVVMVSLRYREEFFDGEQLQRMKDELVMEIPIDAAAADVDCHPEPTPKQIDDLLLGCANGRIIDLPGFGSGFVAGDDGKAVVSATV